MSIAESFLAELEHESVATRKTLERVPAKDLTFKPHAKSMSIGSLAGHLADLTSWGTLILRQDVLDMDPDQHKPFLPATPQEAVEHYDQLVAELKSALRDVSDERMTGMWRLTLKGQSIFELPRATVFRTWVLNHAVHHRAQLGVYLRLLDVPVPAVYGPSADEEP